FSQPTALPVTSSCPPSAARAWTAAAVWLVSTGVLASQSREVSARYGAKEPSAHCWPASQSTAAFGGFTPAASWASSASDWRQTPSYCGSPSPYRAEGRALDGSGDGDESA